MELSSSMCRAGRALLGWSALKLSREAGVGVATVRRFENLAPIRPESAEALKVALENGGIAFIAAEANSESGGEGVRRS